MGRKVETYTLPGLMKPIGPYSHYAKSGDFISISAIAGVDPATQELAGADAASQTAQIMQSMKLMLEHAGSDFDHLLHVTVFLADMADFTSMNDVYEKALDERAPARSVVSVSALPKQGALVTMSAMAVVSCDPPLVTGD